MFAQEIEALAKKVRELQVIWKEINEEWVRAPVGSDQEYQARERRLKIEIEIHNAETLLMTKVRKHLGII